MKALAFAGLCAVALGCQARADPYPLFLKCSYVSTLALGGTISKGNEVTVYRVAEGEITPWIEKDAVWGVNDCLSPNATCQLSDALIQEDNPSAGRYTFRISRITGAFSTWMNGRGRDFFKNDGSCEPTTDPSVNMKPKF